MNLKVLLGALAVLSVGLPSHILAQGAAGSPTEPKFMYTRDSDKPVLELSYSGGMIANPDRTPFVRVYGDGRVLIHRPLYMKKAGDYTLKLSQKELDNLLATFAEEELLNIDEGRLEAMAAGLRVEAGPIELPGDHGVTANVQIRFERVSPSDETRAALVDVDRRITLSVAAVQTSARAQVKPLQIFAAGVRQLEILAERANLVKVPNDQ